MDATSPLLAPDRLTPVSGSAGAAPAHDWRTYPLLSALKDRRSRRFSQGMRIHSGPTAFTSQHPPHRLDPTERALLAFAAAGINGRALQDWDWSDGSGGNVMAGLLGRTASSSDAIQSVAAFIVDDDGHHLVRRPGELTNEQLRVILDAVAVDDHLTAWDTMTVRLGHERVSPPLGPPYNINGNTWSLHAPGTTYVVLVSDVTFLMINVLLELFNRESGFFPLDERRSYLPAGVARWARSRGGHLDDNAHLLKSSPIAYAERLIAETVAVEQGMMLQNLSLMCQALGLSGFPHFTGHDTAWPQALGFDMMTQPASRYLGVPPHVRAVMRLRRQDPAIGYAVGLSSGGVPLLTPYCPPAFPDMAAAVRAVVDAKFGTDGFYRGRAASLAWQSPAGMAAQIPALRDEAVQATIDCCTYLYERYGRFPVYLPAYHTFMGSRPAT